MKPKAGGHTKANGHVDSRAVTVSEVAPLLEPNMKVNQFKITFDPLTF